MVPWPGGWWHDTEDGRMVCDLCPRKCSLKSGDRGFCFVRQNRDGEMVLTTYGKSTGFCIDPIEKKPLNHFYPGTSVLSFGTAGCNLGCKFCQNHDISKARKVELLSEHAMPNTIAQAAVELGCKSVAYTYKRSDYLGRVCNRHGKGVPPGWRQIGGGHGGVHHGTSTSALLRVLRCGECRLESLHGRISTNASRSLICSRCSIRSSG